MKKSTTLYILSLSNNGNYPVYLAAFQSRDAGIAYLERNREGADSPLITYEDDDTYYCEDMCLEPITYKGKLPDTTLSIIVKRTHSELLHMSLYEVNRVFKKEKQAVAYMQGIADALGEKYAGQISNKNGSEIYYTDFVFVKE